MLHNGRQNVITNFKLMVIIFILHIMAMPMLIISAMIQMFENGKAFDLDIYAVIAVSPREWERLRDLSAPSAFSATFTKRRTLICEWGCP